MWKTLKLLPGKVKVLFIFGAFFVLLSTILNTFLPNVINQFIKLIFENEVDKDKEVSIIFFHFTLFTKPVNEAKNTLIIMVLSIIVINLFIYFISILFTLFAGEFTVKFYREEMYKKIQKFSLKNIQKMKPESILTRMTTDVTAMWEFLIATTSIFISGIFSTIIGIVFAIMIDPLMSIAVISIAPIMVIIIIFVGKKVSPLIKKTQKSVEVLTKNIDENILGTRVIKTFNLEKERQEIFKSASQDWFHLQYKTSIIFASVWPLFFMLINILIIPIYIFAAYYVVNDLGVNSDLLVRVNTFVDYLFIISFGILMTVMFYSTVFRAKVSGKRIWDVFNFKTDDLYVENGINLKDNFDIDIQNLNFKYFNKAKENVLSNINLNLKHGQTLGIIGPTGSGKSTLVNLLVNNYLYKEGSIKIGGHEVNEINSKNLHQNVGIVYQDPLLYGGTIRSNLKWANDDATDEEIVQALKDADAYEFVYSFDKKLDHEISQGAKNLSGGQKQRLTIARTLLLKPKILIFDDSTSALDNITSKKIIDNIKQKYDCSLILISQKIAPIKNSDLIIVMNNGNIIASGKHNQLLKTSSYYKDIHQSQLEQ
ncbi:ABC transporter ATP-binding protein [Mycoplasma sp. Mirounga ES2805-ORL]|uniref:ABC transporter ATP-binding protein n=1 Tax=Mycoplasma sp. Mirounga ES2805-ORL TaxID=754514 RepID=UPI00197B8453|nr:ABC transporter ATP-binding protein [Mycoplasma sp. Mirounga ES2805-ORL]QSF13712.1 ABC transporter ATP-binding protein [Mycoplasma sp. Mirounga ES2805-ORL]